MTYLCRYGWFGMARLARDLVLTKIFHPRARLIRRPFFCRGGKNIQFGTNLTSGIGLRLDASSDDGKTSLFFGHNVQLNDYVHIGAVKSVTIGDNVLIASKVFISDHNHGTYSGPRQDSPLLAPSDRSLSVSEVTIGNNVWIGEFVSVLAGATIGDGTIIGANSVVIGHIPDNSIAVGTPAKVIKKYNFTSEKWEAV
jgi:lipopolysaccharide O-acetyltransferase